MWNVTETLYIEAGNQIGGSIPTEMGLLTNARE